jgi:hypothetical protein
MKNLTATICLAVALLFGSAGVSWSQDWHKGDAAFQSGDHATALRCNGLAWQQNKGFAEK